MPTISQLPVVSEVTPADAIPVSQKGATCAVSVGTLLASMQPAIISDSGTLLGRISLGPGGPEPIAVGSGLLLQAGTISVTGDPQGAGHIGGLTPVTTIAGNDLVAINQGGTDHAISYANLLDGLTIDLAQPAVPATDSDTLWVAQGSNTMLRQTFSAIWSWLMTKQPFYKVPVVEISTNTTLDGMVHNGHILICSQPITLTPAPPNMGSGFHCDVINLSAGNVIFGSGITTSSGAAELRSGQSAAVRVIVYSGGTVVFASLSGATDGTAPEAPGQVTGLTTSNPTTSGIAVSWSEPNTGGAVSSYTIQYRISGAPAWSTFATGITSTNAQVTGLAAGTIYEFQVYAVNGGGSGLPSSAATATTSSPAGSVISATWSMVPSGTYARGIGSIGVNAHINPATAAVQFGFSPSATAAPSSWVAATHVNTDIWGAYISIPATPGTWYAWVEGTDGSHPIAYETPFTVT